MGQKRSLCKKIKTRSYEKIDGVILLPLMKDEIHRKIMFSYDLWFWGQRSKCAKYLNDYSSGKYYAVITKTWSQEPLDQALYRMSQAKGQRSHRGSQRSMSLTVGNRF